MKKIISAFIISCLTFLFMTACNSSEEPETSTVDTSATMSTADSLGTSALRPTGEDPAWARDIDDEMLVVMGETSKLW